LSVVNREGNAQDVLGVTDETASGGTEVQVPQSERTVPRGGESELTIRGDDNVLDDVRVSSQSTASITVLGGVLTSQVPDDDSLVSGRRQDHIVAFRSGGDGSDRIGVTL